jgi:hypothetical protein
MEDIGRSWYKLEEVVRSWKGKAVKENLQSGNP